MEMALSDILAAVKDCHNFQDYADCAYRIIDNPILIFDMNLKVLACTNVEVNDPAYQYLSKERYPMPDLTENQSWRKVIRELLSHEEVVSTGYNGLSMLSKVLRFNGVMVGQINAVAYFRPFTEQDFNILELISLSLSTAVYGHLALNPLRGDAAEYLLQYLLDGNLLTSSEANIKAQLLGWNLNQYLYVLCASILDDVGNRYPGYLLGLCGPSDRLIRYRSYVLILLSRNQPIDDAGMDVMESALHSYGISCGISSHFSALNQLLAYYQQAVAALDIGSRVNGSGNLYKYDDYPEYVLIRKCAENEDLQQYIPANILAFVADKRLQGPVMLQTLLYYIKFNRSVQKTSQALTIHRNTVTYRVGKCAEILDIDLNDGPQILHLIHSLQIMEYTDRKRFFSD